MVYRRRTSRRRGAGLIITGVGNTLRAPPFFYLASFWTALRSSVHYPAPELEGVVQLIYCFIDNPLQTVCQGFSPSHPALFRLNRSK